MQSFEYEFNFMIKLLSGSPELELESVLTATGRIKSIFCSSTISLAKLLLAYAAADTNMIC